MTEMYHYNISAFSNTLPHHSQPCQRGWGSAVRRRYTIAAVKMQTFKAFPQAAGGGGGWWGGATMSCGYRLVLIHLSTITYSCQELSPNE